MRRVHSLLHPFFFLFVLLATLCSADVTSSFHVAGNGECADCQENNLKTTQAFPGMRVSIDCKLENGGMQRIAEGDLDEEGKFNVPIPKEVVDENGKKLKQECYAQLHSARATPCPIHNGIESAKIVFKSLADGTTTFAPVKNIKFSSALCSSKTFFKFPPLPTLPPHPWFKPPVYKPPVTVTPPVYKPPVYTPPVYKPPVEKPPVYKPPVYKPPVEKPPVYKPPVYKPPVEKPPVYKPPVYKPPVEKPPVYKPPAEKPPVYKPPVYKPPIEKPPVVVPPVYKPPVATPPVFVHPPLPFFKPPFPKVLPPPFPLFKHPFPKPLPPLPPLPPHPKPKIPSTISHP